MSQILHINILVDWSLSDIMTSKLVIRESESPRPDFTNDEFLGNYPIHNKRVHRKVEFHWFRASYLSFKHLIDRGGCHA